MVIGLKVNIKNLIISMIIPSIITVATLMIILNSILPNMVNTGSGGLSETSITTQIMSDNVVLMVIILAFVFIVVQFLVLTTLTYKLMGTRVKLPKEKRFEI